MPLRLVFLAAGSLLLAGGVALVDRPAGTLAWPDVLWLERYVSNPVEACLGLLMACAGAILVVAATRRPAATPLATIESRGAAAGDTAPRRWTPWVLAAVCAALLVGRLRAALPGLADLVLLGALLSSGALGLCSLDRRRDRSTGLHLLDLVVALVLAVATTLLHGLHSDHWLFASIGDEVPFFHMARDIVAGRYWNPFDVVGGVYDTHSLVDSAYQASVMKLAGVDVRGWRLGLALLMGGAAGGLYLTGVVLRGRGVGMVAAVVLASSHYLMAFSHIGYNNTHAVFVNVLAALALAVSWRTGRWHHHWWAGAALGLSLYSFLAGILFWVIAAVVLASEALRRRSPRHRIALACAVAGFAVTVAPALWVTTVPRLTDVGSRNTVSLAASHHGHLAWHELARENLVRSALSYWSDELITGHHLGGALVDPVTGALLLLGLVAAAAGGRGFAERLALVWFVLGMALIAVSHYEITPSTSRLLTLMPAVALLAALGVARVSDALGSRVVAVAAAVALIAVLPWLNLKQLLVSSPARAMVATRLVMVMKALQEHAPRVVVDVGVEPDWNVVETLEAYPWLQPRYRFVTYAELTPEMLQPLTDAGAVFFIDQDTMYLAEDLQPRLPPDFRRVEDVDRTGRYRTTLLVPAGASSVVQLIGGADSK